MIHSNRNKINAPALDQNKYVSNRKDVDVKYANYKEASGSGDDSDKLESNFTKKTRRKTKSMRRNNKPVPLSLGS